MKYLKFAAVCFAMLCTSAIGGCDPDSGTEPVDQQEADSTSGDAVTDAEPGDAADTEATDGEVDAADTASSDTSDPADTATGQDAADTAGGQDATDTASSTDTSEPVDTSDATPSPDSSDSGGADAGARWMTCSQSSDCTLRKNDCCGWCGEPTLGDLDAVNRSYVKEHEKDVCPKPMPCPKCAQSPIPAGFQANCVASTCQKVDLTKFRGCATDKDCRVRTLDCCEDCTSDTSKEGVVAINIKHASAVTKALCSNSRPVCKRCPISYPQTAVCVRGQCQIK